MIYSIPTALLAICESCQVIRDFLEKQIAGILDEETVRLCIFLLINSKQPEAALEFIKLSPKHEEDDIRYVEEQIEKHKSNPYSPIRCCTFGCSDERITECHPKLIYNSNRESANSPAHFISRDKLEIFKFKQEFQEMREQIYEKIATGDTSAHLDSKYIEAAAKFRSLEPQGYENLLETYKQDKISITAFKEAVDKAFKEVKGYATAQARTEINLPEHLKPFAVGLEGTAIFIGEDGAYYEIVPTKDGEIFVKLTNFVARIVRIHVRVDGVNKNYYFEIESIANGTDVLPTVIIEAKAFINLLWLAPTYGNQAILEPNVRKDSVRYAIQATSKNAPEILVHYQLGLKKINGLYNYFHSNGVIGDQNNATAEITELKGYGFPEEKADIFDCFEAVKVFLEVATKEISILLLSFLLLPLLGEKLKEDSITIRFLLWLYGKTGSLKTALSMVGLSFYGDFINPTATFVDTITSIERQLYLAKDTTVLIDDFCPSSSMSEKRAKESVANKVIRSVGDGTGKKRAKSNLEMSATYPPRCAVLITGEDVLSGHSSNSRLLNQPVNYGDVDTKNLSYLQENPHLLSSFTYHYINYLLENVYNTDGVSFKEEFQRYRQLAKNDNHHKRFADSVALLQISWHQFLKFASHIGAIDEVEYKTMFDEGWGIFTKIAERQNQMAMSQDIAAKYMSALKEQIDTKQIVPVSINVPAHLSSQATVCYHDENNYYFIPQSTYTKVNDFLLRKGELLNVSDFMLRRMLADRGFIVKSADNDGHLTTKIRVGLSQIRVIQIPKRILEQF